MTSWELLNVLKKAYQAYAVYRLDMSSRQIVKRARDWGIFECRGSFTFLIPVFQLENSQFNSPFFISESLLRFFVFVPFSVSGHCIFPRKYMHTSKLSLFE